MEKSAGQKRDAVSDALEGFLKILNKRTGRASADRGPGLLVLIRKKKKKGGALLASASQALKGEAPLPTTKGE